MGIVKKTKEKVAYEQKRRENAKAAKQSVMSRSPEPTGPKAKAKAKVLSKQPPRGTEKGPLSPRQVKKVQKWDEKRRKGLQKVEEKYPSKVYPKPSNNGPKGSTPSPSKGKGSGSKPSWD